MPVTFIFEFALFDPDRTIKKSFPLTCTEYEAEETLCDLQDDFTSKLESEYGVHDAQGGPMNGSYEVGFCTYEVDEDKIDELVEIWKNKLIERGIA